MDKKELTDALVEHKEAIEKMVQEVKDASGKEKEALQKSLNEAKEARDVMQKQLDDIATEQKNAKMQKQNAEVVTFAQDLKKQITAEIKNIKGLTDSHVAEVKMQVKTFLETADASVTTGSLIPWPQLDPQRYKAPDRMPFMIDIVSRGISNSLSIYWVERKTRTDNSEWVDEGVSPASQSVLGYETKSQAMQNLSSFLKVSNNALDDIDWLMSEIQTELVTLHMLKLDAALLTGTVAANGFDGVQTVATAFSAGGDTLPSGVAPNKYDALMYAINQVKEANFSANYIVLHPSDVRDMKLERDDQGAYMLPQYMQTDPAVDGVRIISNTGQTAGTYLVGDFTRAKYWTRKALFTWSVNRFYT
jgi:HK97 family phage major capsid protein